MAEGSTQVEVEPNLRRRNQWSRVVWDKFTLVRDAEGKRAAVCNHCHKILKADASLGTSHLRRHAITHEAAPLLSPSDWEPQQPPPLLSPSDREEEQQQQQQPPPPPLLSPSESDREQQQPPPLLSPSDREQPQPPPLLSPSDREQQQPPPLLSPCDQEQQQQEPPPSLLPPCDPEQQQPLPPCGVVVNQIKFITALVAETCMGIAVHFTPIDQIEEQQQRCAKYSQKALEFAITMFFAYVGAPSVSSTNTTFKIAMAAFFIAVPSDLITVTRAPKWGRLLTCLSWFLLVLLSYLLLVSFNKEYSYAILPLPIPFVIGLLQHKLWPAVFQQIGTDIEAGQGLNSSDEAGQAMNNNSIADKDLDDIFKLSAVIVNFGGLISMIIGHYITGPSKTVNPAVFFFFFTVALGLYLMMVTTVRIAALSLHARHLSYLLMLLLLSTLIATLKAWESGSDSHV